MNDISTKTFWDIINEADTNRYDFEEGIALETSYFYYDESDDATFDGYRIPLSDIYEHIFKRHGTITFENLSHGDEDYASYFEKYYYIHPEALRELVEIAVIENLSNMLNFIRTNKNEDRYVFKYTTSRRIGLVYEKKTGVSHKVNTLFVCMGIDMDKSRTYLVTAFPCLLNYKPKKKTIKSFK